MRLKIAVMLLALAPSALAQAPQPTPMPGAYVHDFAGVIADDKEAEIQAQAVRLKQEFKTEIAVVTVESLGGEDSFDYSMRMARAWGIGAQDEDSRGLLVLVAVKDRQTAFRTSRHTEGELPDGVTGEISREMGAHFKRGDFGGGLSLGMDRILSRVASAYEAPRSPVQADSAGGGLGLWWLVLLILPMGGVALLFVRSAGKRRRTRQLADEKTERRRKARSAAVTRAQQTLPKKSQARSNSTAPKRTKTTRTSSDDESPTYGSGYSSSSSSDDYSSSSSSSSDSGSSYEGSSDFGGGGSDSSW